MAYNYDSYEEMCNRKRFPSYSGCLFYTEYAKIRFFAMVQLDDRGISYRSEWDYDLDLIEKEVLMIREEAWEEIEQERRDLEAVAAETVTTTQRKTKRRM